MSNERPGQRHRNTKQEGDRTLTKDARDAVIEQQSAIEEDE